MLHLPASSYLQYSWSYSLLTLFLEWAMIDFFFISLLQIWNQEFWKSFCYWLCMYELMLIIWKIIVINTVNTLLLLLTGSEIFSLLQSRRNNPAVVGEIEVESC